MLPAALAVAASLGAVTVVVLVVAADETGRAAVDLLAWAAAGSVLAALSAAALAQMTRCWLRVSAFVRRSFRAREERLVLESSRRQLVAWASDDLRSPLSGLRTMVEAVEAGTVGGPDELRRCHQRMLREIGHLGALLEDLAVLGGGGSVGARSVGAPSVGADTDRPAGQELAFDLAYGYPVSADRRPERRRSGAIG